MNRDHRLSLPVAYAMLISVMAARSVARMQDGSQPVPSTADGQGLFLTYCSNCHGTSAHGDGPAAEKLGVRPADLTQLARQSGGAFVAARVQRLIDGRDRDVKSHGSIEMPVWGDAFKHREGLDEAAVQARIEAIVRYLRSIQERSS